MKRIEGTISDMARLMQDLSYGNSKDIYACLCWSEYEQVCDPFNTSQVVANAINYQFWCFTFFHFF